MRLESMIYLAVLGLASLICLSTAKTLNERYSYTEESQRTARNIKNEQKRDVTESFSPTNGMDPKLITIQRSGLRQLIMESLQTMLADVPHDVEDTTIAAVVAPPEASTRSQNNIIRKAQNQYGNTGSIIENPSSQLSTHKSTDGIIYLDIPSERNLIISDCPKEELTDNKRWQSVNDGNHLEKHAEIPKFISSSPLVSTSAASSNPDAPILSMEDNEIGDVDNEVPITANQETGLTKGGKNIQDVILSQMIEQMGLVFSNSFVKVSEVLSDMLENVFSGLKVPVS